MSQPKITVKKAVEMAFKEMPVEFHILQLCRKVKSITSRPYLMDGTITRKMRELKEEGAIRYDVSNRRKSFYVKDGQHQIFSSVN